MSLRVMTWAWSIRLSPAPKLVLMALADEADDNGYCFPSHRRLADKCSLGQRTVRRILGQLELDGFLKVEARFRGDRSRTSNGYYLMSADPSAKMARGVGLRDRGPRSVATGGPGSATPSLPAIDPLENPPQPGAATVAEHGNASRQHGECGGGLHFPEQLSRGQTDALREVLARVDATRQQQVLDELAGRLNVGGITNPIRYCAALVQRVERKQFRPELGIQVAAARAARERYVERLKCAPGVAAAATGATLACLPDDLRAPLERMRKRVGDTVEHAQPGAVTSSGAASVSNPDVEANVRRLARPRIQDDAD